MKTGLFKLTITLMLGNREIENLMKCFAKQDTVKSFVFSIQSYNKHLEKNIS